MLDVAAFKSVPNLQTGMERQATGLQSQLLLRLLDEIDYGIVLATPDGRLLHANHLARHELALGTLMCLRGVQLSAGHATELSADELVAMLQKAARGQRSMIEVQGANQSLNVAFLPLNSAFDDCPDVVLVLFGKREMCQSVTMSFYAKSVGLTPTEQRMLVDICKGFEVEEIARNHHISQSTVRAHIKALRAKTRCGSIKEMIRKISTLPPVVPALRGPARPFGTEGASYYS